MALPENNKKDFKEWLIIEYGANSGTVSSYIRAIEILNELLNEDLYSKIDTSYLDELYSDLLKNQNNINGKYHYPQAESYGEQGFYSASIKSYIKFLSKKGTIKSNPFNSSLNRSLTLLEYKKQIILQGPPGTGKTRMAKKLACQMLDIESETDLKNHSQFEIVQFHPSYTYEDFVRGIVSKPNEEGDGIQYIAENKLLGEFAQKAFDNFSMSSINKTEESLEKNFYRFISFVIEKIDEEQKFEISEKVYIFFVDEVRFKYKGDNWTAHPNGLNMNFLEIYKILELNLQTRQEINKCIELNALTRQHATYYQNVMDLYREFLAKNPIQISNTPLKKYVLIIDEINRANLSSVLGELIYALEYRGEDVKSMYSVNNSRRIILPPNLYIIGTMNTADRSVGYIDYAIRRRFAFVDILPKDLQTELNDDFKTNTFVQVASLFVKNYDSTIDYSTSHAAIERSEYLTNDFSPQDVWLGHSYFIQQYEGTTPIDFNLRIQFEIKPILLEYINDGILKESARMIINQIEV